MDVKTERDSTPPKHRTTAERASGRELVTTRTFDAPPRLVFEAWTRPELLRQWWAPRSLGMSLLSCEADVRVGGRYRLVFEGHGGSPPMAFFGQYLEVVPPTRSNSRTTSKLPSSPAAPSLSRLPSTRAYPS